jgi:hypothetical protein
MIPVEERFDIDLTDSTPESAEPPGESRVEERLRTRTCGRSIQKRTLERDGVTPSGISENRSPGNGRLDSDIDLAAEKLSAGKSHMGRRIEEPHLGHWGPVRRRILESGHPGRI